jgi:hypothetical protein
LTPFIMLSDDSREKQWWLGWINILAALETKDPSFKHLFWFNLFCITKCKKCCWIRLGPIDALQIRANF